MNLFEFACWYKESGYPRNSNPWTGKVFVTDVSSSSIIYVQDQFTVEEYHMFPNAHAPGHSHPVDTLTIFLGGELSGTRLLGSGTFSTPMQPPNNSVGGVLRKGDTHGLTSGSTGATMFTIFDWDNLTKRNSGIIEYYGPSLGPIHDQLLSQRSS
jgi:hypothetical protein